MSWAVTFANVNGFQGGARTVRAYRRSVNLGSVLLLAESWRYRHELEDALPSGWSLHHRNGESPAIAHNAHVWKCLAHGWFHAHEAIPGVSDSRPAAWALLHNRRTGESVLFVSVHLTPSAWSNRYGLRKRLHIRRVWKRGVLTTLRQTRRLQEKYGVPAVIGADVNHKGRTWSRRLGGRRIRYVTGRNPVDKLAFVDGPKREWQVFGHTRKDTPLGTGDGHFGITVRARTRRKLL